MKHGDGGILKTSALIHGDELESYFKDGASQYPPSEAKSDGQKENAPDVETVTWLENLGLSQADFPSFNMTRNKMLYGNSDDCRPTSLVFVERSGTLVLFSFLININSCVRPTGAPGWCAPYAHFSCGLPRSQCAYYKKCGKVGSS
ncbi:hypothetical protein MRX96_041849 [Rhipicephalus microplus]